MHTGEQVPAVHLGVKLTEALVEMTRKGLGMTAVVDDEQRVAGIFTDGDLRRVFDIHADMRDILIDDVMTANCKTIQADLLAAEAVHIMENSNINGFLVVDKQRKLQGAFNMLDLLRAGVV